jgi:hypothetical protein
MIEMSYLKIAIIFVLELICRDQEESRWEVIKIMEGWEEGKDEGIDCFGVVGFVSNHINYIHRLDDQDCLHDSQQPRQVIRRICRRFRCSPTAIIEGREYDQLCKMVGEEEKYQLERAAAEQIFKSQQATTQCPFERERLQILYEYTDPRVNLTFQDALAKMDEIEQRESDREYFCLHSVGKNSRANDFIDT